MLSYLEILTPWGRKGTRGECFLKDIDVTGRGGE